jgi:pectinesterase
LYSDFEKVTCKNVHFKGHQDTLFLSPLPDQEREADGFKGPRQNTPRIMTTQYFENCIIEGDIDFIFGGADAVFKDCTILSLYRPPLSSIIEETPACGSEADQSLLQKALAEKRSGHSFRLTSAGVPVQGFVCAPCTPPDGNGFHFIHCDFTTDCCPDGSVYLARPWRPYAKVTFEDCSFGPHIAPEKFAGWNDIHIVEPTAKFQII